MNVEAMKAAIRADAEIFAEKIARQTISAFAEELRGLMALASFDPEVTPGDTARKPGRPATNALLHCKAEGCPKAVVAKGFCASHYQKARNKAKAREAKKLEATNGQPAAPAVV
jgi:hypothetical protein